MGDVQTDIKMLTGNVVGFRGDLVQALDLLPVIISWPGNGTEVNTKRRSCQTVCLPQVEYSEARVGITRSYVAAFTTNEDRPVFAGNFVPSSF